MHSLRTMRARARARNIFLDPDWASTSTPRSDVTRHQKASSNSSSTWATREDCRVNERAYERKPREQFCSNCGETKFDDIRERYISLRYDRRSVKANEMLNLLEILELQRQLISSLGRHSITLHTHIITIYYKVTCTNAVTVTPKNNTFS